MFVSSSIVASRIYALFVVKSTIVQKLGKGGGGQANLGNARILRAFGAVTPRVLPKDWGQMKQPQFLQKKTFSFLVIYDLSLLFIFTNHHQNS